MIAYDWFTGSIITMGLHSAVWVSTAQPGRVFFNTLLELIIIESIAFTHTFKPAA